MKKISDNVFDMLDRNVDKSLIQQRVMFKDRFGKEHVADYISGSTAIMLLNKIIGHRNWSFEVRDFSTDKVESPKMTTHIYRCIGRLTVRFEGDSDTRVIQREDVGVSVMDVREGRAVLSSVLEAQIKGAVTDALKRCARQVGQALGNSLYMDDDLAESVSAMLGTEEEGAPAEKVNEIKALIQEVVEDPDKYVASVLQRLNIGDLSQIPSDKADKLLKALKAKRGGQ